jgi:outer membrane protein OmpA-like peptidoglycan-associated protein
MHRGTVLLALVGSIAIVAPAMASDKLPKPRGPAAAPAPATAPVETPDPSTEPLPDSFAPPTASASEAAPPATQPPSPAPATMAGGPNASMIPDYPFVLFFEWDSADLSAGGAEVLDNVADKYRRIGGRVTISGYTDKSGAGDYNRDLSQRRVGVVRAYLASKDIPSSAIATQAFGETKAVVDTADGMREPQNRRVEVMVSPAAVTVR